MKPSVYAVYGSGDRWFAVAPSEQPTQGRTFDRQLLHPADRPAVAKCLSGEKLNPMNHL
jgi:hypothetical protein